GLAQSPDEGRPGAASEAGRGGAPGPASAPDPALTPDPAPAPDPALAPGQAVALGSERVLCREDFSEEWIAEITARAARLGDYKMLSPEEREASRQTFLTAIPPGEDAWVFGYGSLMWNPAIHVAETRSGVVHGYHRWFSLTMMMGRG